MRRVSIVIVAFLLTVYLLEGCIPVCGLAGSYPCAKTWELKISEAELKTIISDIKKENPDLSPPISDSAFISHQQSYWYHIYFYFSDTKEIVYTWTRPGFDFESTTFALIGFSEDGDKKTYKEINSDYNWNSNAKHINKFKDKILNLIQKKIKQKR